MKSKDNAIIEIITVQRDFIKNEEDTINLVSSANIKKGDIFDLISYEESEITGLKGNKTVIKIEKDNLTMIRYGKNPSKMYFKQGVQSDSLYSTDYGNFDIQINTKKLDIRKEDEKNFYKIKIEYDINIKNLFNGSNSIDIIIKDK